MRMTTGPQRVMNKHNARKATKEAKIEQNKARFANAVDGDKVALYDYLGLDYVEAHDDIQSEGGN